MKKLLSVACVSFMFLGLTACGDGGNKTPSAEKKIIALTNSGYAPYETRTPEGELIGFDVDLMNAIGEKLGYTIEWSDIDFDALIGSVKSGVGDLVIAGMSPDKKRAEEVDFSEIYYQSDDETANFVMCLEDSGINSTEDLKNKIAGVQIGTIQESAVNEIKDDYNLEIDSRKSYGDMIQEIKNKRIDFVVIEKAIADEYMANNDGLKLFQLEVEGANSTGNVIAYKKGSPLKEEIDVVIKEMKENGEMDKLVKKWFTGTEE